MSFLLALLAACATPEPTPVAPPHEFVGTWRAQKGEDRMVITADGHYQHTAGKFTNTGLVLKVDDAGFEVTGYPHPEVEVVAERPHEQDGYWWMTVNDVRYWRASEQAVIGKPLPPDAEKRAPADPGAATLAPTEPAAPAEPAAPPEPAAPASP